jgi:large subunit ribosomal protein L10
LDGQKAAVQIVLRRQNLGLSLEQKQATVTEVQTKLAGAQSVIVAEYRGLNVERVTQLRSKARKSGVYLRVLKNTLARRAIKGTPFEKLSEQMVGPLMYGISQDPVAGAKVLSEFAKENELFVIKAGAMPNAMMSAQDIKALAQLPSREELLATLLGTLQAPMAKLVRTLNEVPGKFVRTLAAYRDSKEKAAA